MIIVFATKRDVNGNRYHLEMNTETKTLKYNTLIHKSDIIEVPKSKLYAIEDMAKADGYTIIN